MMLEFAYEALPGRVVFGAGARRTVAAEAAALGGRRVMLVADRAAEAAAEEIADGLGRRAAGRFDGVAQHVPADKARAAVAAARELGADTVITVGGGSATGFGKAIALQLDVRLMAVPTTYAGSEMTPIWGLTDGDRKQTGADARVKPEVVVYDPELTLGLPAAVAGPSGMNAVAHAVEATYGPGANPVITLMALEALKALARALPAVVADPDDLAARTEALYGAYLAGVALAAGGTALHHKACHVLGGMFDLDHGKMNAVILSHALAYNAPAVPGPLERVAGALGATPAAAPGRLQDLAEAVGAPLSLEAIGMPAAGLDEAARRLAAAAEANVRPPTAEGMRRMLEDAFCGRRPRHHP